MLLYTNCRNVSDCDTFSTEKPNMFMSICQTFYYSSNCDQCILKLFLLKYVLITVL